jgi:outer membrane cobalamin receptor
LYRVEERVTVWGSISKGFRAPTLKELYSPFRVGQVLTQSNETLGPEHLTGGEAGISVAPMPG